MESHSVNPIRFEDDNCTIDLTTVKDVESSTIHGNKKQCYIANSNTIDLTNFEVVDLEDTEDKQDITKSQVFNGYLLIVYI